MENSEHQANPHDAEKAVDHDTQSTQSKSTDQLSMVRPEKDQEAQTASPKAQVETNADLVGSHAIL